MSRELLKRAATLIKCLNGASWEHEVPQVVIQEIDAYLAQPEPEPVAGINGWYGGYPTICIINGTVLPVGMALYTTPPDQSAQIAELKKDNNITHENLAWYMEKYHEHLTIIAELEKSEAFLKDAVNRAIQDTEYYQEQLAALQAKREPLSDEEVNRIAMKVNPWSGYRFARAIEAAHGIGVNHE